MALNRSGVFPNVPSLRCFKRTESVQYPGLSLSQSPVKVEITRSLEERFFRWLSPMTSSCTHTQRKFICCAHDDAVTPVAFHITCPTIRRWQALLNKFVLTRKYDPAINHFHLITKQFLYQRREEGGLQIPSIDAHIKSQRLQLMQQFMGASRIIDRNLTTPGLLR
ncbi:hypothetical protein PsorP6_011661 [Peronosclerospora sorghi]|uniref:Uncharacterized protein n=1 Tax=Peronosclerospora sorghi TaxID=230839 RepID=A0ACC0WKQ6_9STRA|nr:hypothetical protein PsorP6_011661 [Peronosclerospora sorghi]